MAGHQLKGKGIVAVVRDIADGFLYLTPILLKKYQDETHKTLYRQIKKIQKEIRSEAFPSHDALKIRNRNLQLQRLHTAAMVLENYARVRRITLV